MGKFMDNFYFFIGVGIEIAFSPYLVLIRCVLDLNNGTFYNCPFTNDYYFKSL